MKRRITIDRLELDMRGQPRPVVESLRRDLRPALARELARPSGSSSITASIARRIAAALRGG
jgi:hypothetical protein